MLKKIRIQFESIQLETSNPNKLAYLIVARIQLLGVIVDPKSTKKEIKEAQELLQLISFCFN